MIRVTDLSAGYRKEPILRDLSLSIPAGHITVLLGVNGSGKTTLLKTLAGLLPARTGQILLGGRSLDAFSPRERASAVAFMPQTRPTPVLTAEQLLSCARYPHVGLSHTLRKEDRAAIARAIDLCDITPLLSRDIATLSGGEQQRVYLAAALAQGASVLLLDEPTAHLDAAAAFTCAALLRRLRDEGVTVAAAMHDLPLALSLADRVVVIQNGTVIFEGTPDAAVESDALARAFGVRVTRHTDGYAVLPL